MSVLNEVERKGDCTFSCLQQRYYRERASAMQLVYYI